MGVETQNKCKTPIYPNTMTFHKMANIIINNMRNKSYLSLQSNTTSNQLFYLCNNCTKKYKIKQYQIEERQ